MEYLDTLPCSTLFPGKLALAGVSFPILSTDGVVLSWTREPALVYNFLVGYVIKLQVAVPDLFIMSLLLPSWNLGLLLTENMRTSFKVTQAKVKKRSLKVIQSPGEHCQ